MTWTYVAKDQYRNPEGWTITRVAAGWIIDTGHLQAGPFRLLDDAIEAAGLMPLPDPEKAKAGRAVPMRDLKAVALRELQEGDGHFAAARAVRKITGCSWDDANMAVEKAAKLFATKGAA